MKKKDFETSDETWFYFIPAIVDNLTSVFRICLLPIKRFGFLFFHLYYMDISLLKMIGVSIHIYTGYCGFYVPLDNHTRIEKYSYPIRTLP